ncbi:hypothetical protein FRZ03_28955 [Streptomyces misionensis]|uniref:MmyB-like transcription regulator ligand binding domain-containing protein n=1 Tax=Streptomyces misionensis TaxID=67331 RepID=A0A5C6IYB9_9ACTN|nr:hypothetical protein [Streptomyces misionensis]TWV34198.1 hypothetical protein FRZ03_28955 [Streptomyces misionensis]
MAFWRAGSAARASGFPRLLRPRPAYIIAGDHDVLSRNEAAGEPFPNLAATQERPANLARRTFLEPAAREIAVDREREALARLRTLAARHPGDPHHTRLIDDLHAGSEQVRAGWPRYDVRVRQGGRKPLRPPGREPAEFVYTAFHLAEQPELTLVAYT